MTAPARPSPSSIRRGRARIGIAVAAIVAVQAALLTIVAWHSYFYADDFPNLARARHDGLSWKLLSSPIFGHLTPVHHLADWALARTTSLNWSVAAVVLVALPCLSTIVLARLLGRLFVVGPGMYVLLALFAFSPMWFRSTQWWATGMHQLPVNLFLLIVAERLAAFAESRRPANLVVAVAALILALLTDQRPLIAPALILLSLAAGLAATRPLRTAARRVVSLWPAWIALGGVSTAIGAWYLADYYRAGTPPPAGQFPRFLWTGLSDGVIAHLSGLSAGHLSCPDGACRATGNGVLSAAVLVVVVASSLVRRPRAWFPWCALALIYLALMVPLGLERIGPFGPGIAGDVRYTVEFLPYLVVGLGFIFLRSRSAETETLRVGPLINPRVAAVLGVWFCVVFLIPSIAVAVKFERAWPPTPARDYVETARRSIGGRPTALYDLKVSDALRLVADDDYSQVLGLLDEPLSYDRPNVPLGVLDASGQVRDSRLVELSTSAPPGAAGCLDRTRRSVEIHLADPQVRTEPYLEVSVRSSERTTLRVDVLHAGTWIVAHPGRHLDVPAGTNLLRFAIRRDPNILPTAIRLTSGGGRGLVCVERLVVGQPAPA